MSTELLRRYRGRRTQPRVVKAHPPSRLLLGHEQRRPVLEERSTFPVHKRDHFLSVGSGRRRASQQRLGQQQRSRGLFRHPTQVKRYSPDVICVAVHIRRVVHKSSRNSRSHISSLLLIIG